MISLSEIRRGVAEAYKLSIDDMVSTLRPRRIAYPRQVVMYLARELTDASLPRIGQMLGNRDHTTILYGCRKVKARVQANPVYAAEVHAIRQRILSKAPTMALQAHGVLVMPSTEAPRNWAGARPVASVAAAITKSSRAQEIMALEGE